MPSVPVGPLEIEYESFGDGEPLVLIMGLGAQMTLWREGFCEQLASHGYRVIRFDNRDVGLSTKIKGARIPPLTQLLTRGMLKLPLEVPYRLEDMADDCAGLIQALGLESAHVVGASMGGMIAQWVAIRHPRRVRSLTSIMSHTGRRREFVGHPKALLNLFARSEPTKEAVVERSVKVFRAIGSPRYFDEAEVRALSARNFERSFYPAGYLRHMAAVLGSGSRYAALRQLKTPTMVLHGAIDPLIPVRGGKATAEAIPGSRLRILPDMAHDLPRPLWPALVGAIREVARD